ncbi:DNA recombination protein RmuC [Rhizobium alvei]|uniref:DNA recombination protein RmuC homolog n=1 Tax=Rhizobium alvei TaxID=1132659 RepID=A0ABT8YPG2_9HYPH|nr:DNA recombination protein RmuC [Rhizobium alvei]MDO6965182.1 DNA recombination protein RmuC [Rhizobium alvei]
MELIGSLTKTVSPVGLAVVGGALTLLVLIVVVLVVRGRRQDRRAEEAETQLASILHAQMEMQGRIAAMTQVFSARQAELNQGINNRIDGMTQRIGQTMSEQARATHENLRALQERLAVIDSAQSNIRSLASDIVGLQAILSNKQTRGAFGQARMEAIIADGLPLGAYEFQSTLSNGSRPDCLIRMPNGQPSLVIDAKFPLEAWNAIRDADADASAARQQFRRDLEFHVKAIAEKYLLKGETQDTALMFVPSESIFADIHENCEALVQKAHRLHVVIVSPSLLMLSVQVIQSVLRDQRMREQAHVIQGEVLHLMQDLGRLDERVQKLQSHFSSAQRDVEQIAISTSRIVKRGQRIESLDFTTPAEEQSAPLSEAKAASVRNEGHVGQLRFRIVDEE